MKLLLLNRVLYARSLPEQLLFRLTDRLLARGHKVMIVTGENRNNVTIPGADCRTVETTPHENLTEAELHRCEVCDPKVCDQLRELLLNEELDAAIAFHISDSLTWGAMEMVASHGVPIFMAESDFSRACPAGRFLRPVGDRIGNLRRSLGDESPIAELKPCMACMPHVPAGSVCPEPRLSAVHSLNLCRLFSCVDQLDYSSARAVRTEKYLREPKHHRFNKPTGWLVTSEHHADLLRCALPTTRPIINTGIPIPDGSYE